MSTIESALNPAAGLGVTRSRERPLSAREQMQRGKAACAAQPDANKVTCTGNLFVGIFFDGTGNNEDEDYKKVVSDRRKQKHSNVVRLYHAYSDQPQGSNGYYRYYMPGVGTEFKEIGDKGGTQGSAMAAGGEARIIWGLTRIFNAVHAYHFKAPLISDAQAARMTEGLGGYTSMDWDRRRVLKGTWQTRLKAAIRDRKPEILQINVSVFGFSRGAAQARAFTNWLYEICEKKDGGYRFADIPLRVQFLGIFDTVASVGVAPLFADGISEGHDGWAKKNMQIHPGVERCLHLVAGHEVRACFPLDSVRIDGKYPANTKEYIYPGSHSDVGGGYMPMCLGQADWNAAEDPQNLQLARVPGFEMYCASIAASVPFRTIQTLLDTRQREIADALTPATSTLNAFRAYYQQAKIKQAPVEDMARQHMNWYLNYRWQAEEPAFKARGQYHRAQGKPNKGDDYAAEPEWLLHTQRALMRVAGAVGAEVRKRMAANDQESEREGKSVVNPCDKVVSLYAALGGLVGLAVQGKSLWDARHKLLTDDKLANENAPFAREAPKRLKEWKEWLASYGYPLIYRTDAPEREPLWVLEALNTNPVPADIAKLFDELVHDSMAGFIGFGMREFEFNGHGLAKFRRIYFGNRGDAVFRERIAAENEARIAKARAVRNEILIRNTPPPVPSMGEIFGSMRF
ncbi:MAG: DUF2235 domain-containing protein [Pseudomonadota bacterium]